ncbi:putative RNA repair pathway DNA polymerase beta [Acinetobacter phage PhaR5]|nr:putative RNA repair pathway DNA polymerase beta [Acinetobacter phage PhaR5]
MKERLVMQCVFGSKLYGTSTPSSDLDIKGIFIPDAKSIIMGNALTHYNKNTNNSHSKNTADDVDVEMYSLKYFIELAIKGETIALDMLHTPPEFIVDYDFMEPWDFIVANRSMFYTTDMKAYLGYVKKQAAKYGIKGTRMAALRQVHDAIKDLPEYRIVDIMDDAIEPSRHISRRRDYRVSQFVHKLPINEYCKIETDPKTGSTFYNVMGVKHQLTIKMSELKRKIATEWDKYGERARQAELNNGIDWKAMHHAIRGGLQLQEIYKTGDLKYPLKDRELLMDIKLGKLEFKEVSTILEDLISDVDKLSAEAAKNGMRSSVDKEFWDKFIFDVYKDQVKMGLKL